MDPANANPNNTVDGISRRRLIQAALLSSGGLAAGCRSSRPDPSDEDAIGMYLTVADWVDDMLIAQPNAPGFEDLMAWMRREYPPDLSDAQVGLLFAEMFMEGRRARTSGESADVSSSRTLSKVPPRPPITRRQTEMLLLSPIEGGRLPEGFFHDRLARAEERTRYDSELLTRYEELGNLQDSPLFKRKRGGNGGKKCGWFCRVRTAILVVAVVVVGVIICSQSEECREALGG